MKLSTTLAIMALSGCAGASVAEPVAYPISSNNVNLIDISPDLPDLEVFLTYSDIGGGSGLSYFAPNILERGVAYEDADPPTTYWVEAANLGSFSDPYPMTTGAVVDDAIGSWVHPRRHFSNGNTDLFRSHYYQGGKFYCWTCGTGGDIYLNTTGADDIRYLPFRVQPIEGGDWNYGWVAMRAISTRLEHCTNPCGSSNDRANQVVFDYIAVGYESEPNTPIVAGAGRCPADLTDDLTVDFFDVSTFLGLYADGNLDADLDGSGTLDFFDISEFIDRYGDGCLF